MQAVILAAGLGTRMGELTRETPKPLLKLGDKSILEQILQVLPEQINEVILVVGYLGAEIEKAIGENFEEKKITYVKQKELKGTAHALTLCKDLLRDRFLVLMGDDIYKREDLEKLIACPLAVLGFELRRFSETDVYALIKVDSQGKLADIVERQKGKAGTLANCGAYVLDRRYFELPLVHAGNKTEEYGLPQTMLQLVKNGAKFDILKATYWHKVTSPEDLEL